MAQIYSVKYIRSLDQDTKPTALCTRHILVHHVVQQVMLSQASVCSLQGLGGRYMMTVTVAAPNHCYCLNQASLTMRTRGRAGKFPVGGKPIGLKQLLMWRW